MYYFNGGRLLTVRFPWFPVRHVRDKIQFVLSLFDDLWHLTDVQNLFDFIIIIVVVYHFQAVLCDFFDINSIRCVLR